MCRICFLYSFLQLVSVLNITIRKTFGITIKTGTNEIYKDKPNSQSGWIVSWVLSQHLKHRKIKGLNKHHPVKLKPLESELGEQ